MSQDRAFDPARLARLRGPARLARLRIPEVTARAVSPATVTALDVGTGTGVFAEALLAAGVGRVFGLDRSPTMLAELTRLVPVAEALQAEADAVPLPDASVDLVFAGLVLHELPDPVRALREWRRLASERVAVLEWPWREESVGPPLEHRVRPDQVLLWGNEAGLGGGEVWDGGTVVLFTWSLHQEGHDAQQTA